MKNFRFYPVSSSWIAFHPQPKGVILFIGGAFYGSFASFFYSSLLEQLFKEGYTIVALPFRFTWRHWSVALSLLREQQVLRSQIPGILKNFGWHIDEIYLENRNYIWLGHSLGCKYIALLEFLADWQSNAAELCDSIRQSLPDSQSQVDEITRQIKDLDISLKDQCSILMAPEISGTEAAIRVPLLPGFIDHLGLGVHPTPEETFALIKSSSLFNLTALISFNQDQSIAGTRSDQVIRNRDGTINRSTNTVPWLLEVKPQIRTEKLYQEVTGGHLRPVGSQFAGQTVGPIAAPPLDLLPTILELVSRLKLKHGCLI